MKTKKMWVWSIAGLAVVVALIVWACVSEYGDGYSEDQRRNWNEMVDATIDDPDEYWDAFGSDSPWITQLEKRMTQPDVPMWNLELFPSDSDVLPLEGMSSHALNNLAAQGNGDACLELVFRVFNDNSGWGGSMYRDQRAFYFEDVGSVYKMEKYLKLAVKSGRPGADLLLRVFESRKNGENLSATELDGYESFISLLDQGDFAVGKVFIYFHLNQEKEWDRISEGLKKKVQQGDAVSLRNAAYFDLLRKTIGRISHNGYSCSPYLVNNHSPNDGCIVTVMKFLWQIGDQFPDLYGKIEKANERFKKWGASRDWTRFRTDLKLPLGVLREAALQGDLHAQFLWSSYSFSIHPSCSREDWDLYKKSIHALAKAGGIYEDWIRRNKHNPGLVCYQTSSIHKGCDLLKARKQTELSFNGIASKDSNIRDMDLAAEEDWCLSLFNYMWIVNYGNPVSREFKEHGAKLIEMAAEEGDPVGMIYWAILLEHGKAKPEDVGRAWSLLQKLRAWRDGIQGEIKRENTYVFHYNREGERSLANYWEYAITWQMIDIVMRRGDMPGMTLTQAFDLFMEKLNNSRYRANHEKNIQILKEQFEKKGFKVPEEKK